MCPYWVRACRFLVGSRYSADNRENEMFFWVLKEMFSLYATTKHDSKITKKTVLTLCCRCDTPELLMCEVQTVMENIFHSKKDPFSLVYKPAKTRPTRCKVITVYINFAVIRKNL